MGGQFIIMFFRIEKVLLQLIERNERQIRLFIEGMYLFQDIHGIAPIL
jgi:hypothetical protein